MAAQGLGATTDEQSAPVLDDNTTNTDNRPIWILASHWYFSSTQAVRLNCKSGGMVGVDFPRRGI
jgi:hypothetical protein